MDSRRWTLIQDLFHATVAWEKRDRNEFLRRRCQGDQSLFSEIQSLVACHETRRPLWDDDKVALGLKLLVLDEGLNVDKTFGNYTLKWIIGRGGMGDVYLACDNKLGRHVALKFLPHSLRSDPQWSLRFHEEARAASSISHPNVAHIYELGNVDDREYIAMEFIDGVTAREKLKLGRIDLSEAIEICEQVGRGIAAAHAVGVLHRDIKPENIMLAADGFVKVLDFGLAKTSTKAKQEDDSQCLDSALTSSLVLGTVAYMSPEQLRGEHTDLRTDIWSLGVTLYELICGHQPFCGRTYGELRNAVLFEDPLSLQIVNGNSSAKILVQDILTRALQKNKEDRYGSIEEFVNDLKRVKMLLHQSHAATPSQKDHITAAKRYPPTPAFQRTSELVEAVPAYNTPQKLGLLTFSLFLLTSLGFFGVLLATQEIGKLFYRLMNVRDSNFSKLIHPFIATAANLLGGFAVGRVATLIKTSRPIRHLLAVVALVLGYALFFLTFHWLPSVSVFVIYTAPYLGLAVVGASIVFRPWSLFRLGSLKRSRLISSIVDRG